ncbi:MAG TPA: hypothetical protein VFN14_01370 [Candidatus Limnocylindria bacterium]|nr:hypothetical protein [Candidatus Limnocylindria bacterium]
MKRLLLALIAGATVFTVAFASAATLSVNGNVIQAGVDGNVQCDTDGVDTAYGLETSDNTVRYVRIENIDPACNGADAFLKVNEATGDAMGPVTIADGKATFHFSSPYPSPESISSIRVWIEG